MLSDVNGAVTRIVRLAEAPLARLPISQLTIPGADWLAEPADGVADRKVTPGGRVSVTLTPLALPGPLLVTARV